MVNISPLRYPGGKTRACSKLDTILNEYFDIKDIKNIISPFFGIFVDHTLNILLKIYYNELKAILIND
jgi:site-specific DNA-adenine methylase